MNRTMAHIMFFTLGLLLLISWVQVTLTPLIRFGMDILGAWGGMAGICFSLATGVWVFTAYLGYAIKALTALGYRPANEDK